MPEQLQLEIVTPERRVLSETVDSVQLPGMNGELGILPGHTPVISQLQTGVLAYVQAATTHQLHVSGGFTEVSGNRISVLAEIAERPEEIDAAAARAERERAERALSNFNNSEDEQRHARAELDRANVRLQLTANTAR